MSKLDGNAILELVKTRLAELYPARVVTRKVQDFASRSISDLRKGIYTVIAAGARDLKAESLADHQGKLRFYVLAQIQLQESADGLAVETAEWAMWGELEAFFNAPGPGLCPVDALDMDMSSQAEAPYGWVAVQCQYSELD